MNIQNTPSKRHKIVPFFLGLGFFVSLFASVSATETTTSSTAATASSASKRATYVGASFGSSTYNTDLFKAGNGATLEDGSTPFSVFWGTGSRNEGKVNYDIEVFYTHFGDIMNITFASGATVIIGGEESTASGAGEIVIDASTFGAAIKPVFKAGDFDLFGKLGIHRYSGNATVTEGENFAGGEFSALGTVFGAGAKYNINESFSILAAFDLYNLAEDDGSLTVFSAGAQYNF